MKLKTNRIQRNVLTHVLHIIWGSYFFTPIFYTKFFYTKFFHTKKKVIFYTKKKVIFYTKKKYFLHQFFYTFFSIFYNFLKMTENVFECQG